MPTAVKILLSLWLVALLIAPASAITRWRYDAAWYNNPASCGATCGTFNTPLAQLGTQWNPWGRVLVSPTTQGGSYLAYTSIRNPHDPLVHELYVFACDHCDEPELVYFASGTFANRYFKRHRTHYLRMGQNRYNTPSCSGTTVQTSGTPDGSYDEPLSALAVATYCSALSGQFGPAAKLVVYREFERVPQCDSISSPFSTQGAPYNTCCTGPLQGNGACGCEATGTCTVDAIPDLPAIDLLPARYSVDSGDISVAIGRGTEVEDDNEAWYLECNTEIARGHPGGGTCNGSGTGCTMNACCSTAFLGSGGNPWNGAITASIGGKGTIASCTTAGLTYLGIVPTSDTTVVAHPAVGSALLADDVPALHTWSLGRPIRRRGSKALNALTDRLWHSPGTASSQALPINSTNGLYLQTEDRACAAGGAAPNITNSWAKSSNPLTQPASWPLPKAVGTDGCFADGLTITNGDSGASLFVYDASASKWYSAGHGFGTLSAASGKPFGFDQAAAVATVVENRPINSSSGQDTRSPNPSPATFSTSPTGGAGQISMTASTATDPEGAAVTYRFVETTGNASCNAREWTSSASYTDTVTALTQCCYRVQSRDASDNRTRTNASVCATAS